MQCKCALCGATFDRHASAVNRAASIAAPLYCGKVCSGLARRKPKPPEHERKAAKAEYDRQRREVLGERIRAEKRAYYQANRERILADMTAKRPAKMAYHVAYCATPEYKAKKSAYDKRKRFDAFGPFAEAAMLLDDLEKEISARASRYEIYIANGRFTRSAQQRRRELWQLMQRN